MHVTAKLVLKLADFKVERTVGVDKDNPQELRGQLETEAREALGDLCNLIYDEALVRRAKADAAIAEAKRAAAGEDPRQPRLPGTDGTDGAGGIPQHAAECAFITRLEACDCRGVTAPAG